ncbi:MAG: SRPBCC family protein [Caldilineales bacterium]
MLVQMSVDINAPPEKVWPYLVEPEKAKQWFTALKVYEWTSDPPGGPGSTFYWEELVGSNLYKLHFETTEWVENRLFVYRMTSGDFFKSYDERWEIEPTASGSRFSFNDHIEFPYGPFGKLIGLYAARGARKTGATILPVLKRLAEGSE